MLQLEQKFIYQGADRAKSGVDLSHVISEEMVMIRPVYDQESFGNIRVC